MALRTDEIGFGGLKLVQDSDQFCYGVDAVLLADFCRAGVKDRVFELGSGNGAVSFMIWAKYRPAFLAGAELQERAWDLSQKSLEINGLSDKITFINTDISELKTLYPAGSATLVVSNPPYFEKGSAIVSSGDPAALARHESTASLSDFMEEASRLLETGGRFCMVHRPSRLADIIVSARMAGLEPKIVVPVVPKAGKAANIMLFEFQKGAGKELKFLPQLVLRNGDGSFSDELCRIYGSFFGHDGSIETKV